MKAIVVDDSRAMRAILKRVLSQAGFEVLEAGDGRQGLDELGRSGRLDLAVVDWNMPVMSGIEMIREVRAKRDFDGMSIMMVSTEAETAQVDTAISAGADAYVTKPFTEAVLRDKLVQLGLSGA